MKLREVRFGDVFFFKGNKYQAVISPKKMDREKNYYIVCAQYPQGAWVRIMADDDVKPVFRP